MDIIWLIEINLVGWKLLFPSSMSGFQREEFNRWRKTLWGIKEKELGQLGPLLNCVCFFATIAPGFSVQYFFLFFWNEFHFVYVQKNSNLFCVPIPVYQNCPSGHPSLNFKGSFWLWTVNLCSPYSIEIHDLYSPSYSPSPSHQFEFALQVKLGGNLATTEGSSELKNQTKEGDILSTWALNVGLIEGKRFVQCWVYGRLRLCSWRNMV